MPRSTRSRRGKSDTGTTAVLEDPDPPLTETEEIPPVTTDTLDNTDQETPEQLFEFSFEPAPEDYEPEKKSPGRVRVPSWFDDVLRREDVFLKGYQRIPVSSDEHREFAIREINRSKLFLNGVGKPEGEPEIGIDFDEKQPGWLYFKVRVAQKRERKAKDSDNGSEALDENSQEDGTYDEDGDNDA